MISNPARSNRKILLIIAGIMFMSGPAAWTQVGADTAAKAPTFDVVSIKPNNSGREGGAWGVSQNIYRARNTPLSRVILQAYLGPTPSEDRLKNAPSWVMKEPYDITAKVDNTTADAWKGKKQDQQVTMAAPMLRAMLEDRCKLVAHTVPTELQGFALVVGKHGIKMKVAQPNEPAPPNFARFEGGWMIVYPDMKDPSANQTMTYLQVTMADFTRFLSLGGTQIVDQTGLTGKYDFDLPIFDTSASDGGEGAAPALRPDAAHMFNWAAIGLEIKPIKIPAFNLVVDHIEKPSAN
ncbi:MAG: TIGR03435 family protein [Bryobacteraceae bacterium]|nr:TIGR03435 family protein [Bryobacteraceae bacterium]